MLLLLISCASGAHINQVTCLKPIRFLCLWKMWDLLAIVSNETDYRCEELIALPPLFHLNVTDGDARDRESYLTPELGSGFYINFILFSQK